MKRFVFVGHRDLYFGAEAVMFRVISIIKTEQLGLPIVILPKSRFNGFRKNLGEQGLLDVEVANYKLINASILRSLLCIVYNVIANIGLIFRLSKKDINLVYTNTSVNIFGALLALIIRKPHIWHFHEQPTGGDFKWIPKGLYPLYRYLIQRRGTKLIFISKCQKKLWELEFGVVISNHEIIYSPPLNMNQESPVSCTADVVGVGFLGSFTASKNIFSLLHSFSIIVKRYPAIPLKLFLMGDGELSVDLRKSVRELNIAENVSFMQHSRDITTFFSLIDIFVLPSCFESWGLVVLEAISFKKAVICTSNTGLTEVLKQDEDCIFVDPLINDHLLKALEKLIINKSFREYLADNSYQSLRKLNLEHHFNTSIRSIFH